MKKRSIIYTLLCTILFAFNACVDDNNLPVAAPGGFEQGPIFDPNYKVSLSNEGAPIVLTETQLADSVALMKCDKLPLLSSNTKLTFKLEVSKLADFVEVSTLPIGFSGKEGADVKVAGADLNTKIQSLFGKSPVKRELFSRLLVYVSNEGVNTLLSSDKMTLQVTPVPPNIESAYYIIGDVNIWNTTALIPFTHNPATNVFDDPIFKFKGRLNGNFKIVSQSTKDLWDAGTGNWDKVMGTKVDGDTSLEGILIESAGAIKVENDQEYLITINMEASTYTIEPIAAVQPSLHFIGAILDAAHTWDNANYSFVLFRDKNETVDTYTGKFKAGEFKFISKANLGTWDNLYGTGGIGVLTQIDGANIAIATEGYYTIDANTVQKTYSITPYDASSAKEYTSLGLVGELTGWGGSPDILLTKSNYDPHIWSADVVIEADGELKFRAESNWATSWGGTTFPYGGKSGDNIKVEAGSYFVKFNDLTSHYVFYKK